LPAPAVHIKQLVGAETFLSELASVR
jgi:hypothetical protein